MRSGFQRRGPAPEVASLILLVAAVMVLGACSSPPATQPSLGGGGSVGPGGAASGGPPPTAGATGDGMGTWSLTLTGGSKPGDYSGRDVMNCIATGEKWTVSFRPVSPVVSNVGASYNGSTPASISIVVHDEDDTPVDYFTDPGTGAATVLEGPTVSNGVLSVKVQGGGALLTAVCPIAK